MPVTPVVETHDVSTPPVRGGATSPLGSPLRPGRDDPVPVDTPQSQGDLADMANVADEASDGEDAAAAPAASSSDREPFNQAGFQAAVDKAVAEASAVASAAAAAAASSHAPVICHP